MSFGPEAILEVTTEIPSLKNERRTKSSSGCVSVGECRCLCTVDRKGQHGASGCPLLTGRLWRAREAAAESSLMVEMDGQYPCGVIPLWPLLTSDIWPEDRCQRGRQRGTEVIGQLLLGDAEAEYIFELLPLSRVMPEVIECARAPAEGYDDNFFSASRRRKVIFKSPA